MKISPRILLQVGLVFACLCLTVFILDRLLTDRQIDIAGKVVTAFATVTAAGIASHIAWRQWKTADAQRHTAAEKLRLDLALKRWDVFRELTSTVTRMRLIGGTTEEMFYRFSDLCTEVVVLFDDETINAFSRFLDFVQGDFPGPIVDNNLRAEGPEHEIMIARLDEAWGPCLKLMKSVCRFN